MCRSGHEWFENSDASNSFFVNTTFDDDDGNVNFATFTLEGAHDAVQSNFNITLNNATLNSSALPDMNTSATITFEGITAVNPTPIVDFENDGTFVACTAISDPVCEEVSFVGGVYVFTVTHFTTYSTTELVPEVDISNTGLLFTNSTSYAALSFFMQNLGAALNVFNWTFDTSESVISSNLVTNLTSNETIFVFIENGFSTNGTFMVVANGTTIEDQDSESVEVGIG